MFKELAPITPGKKPYALKGAIEQPNDDEMQNAAYIIKDDEVVIDIDNVDIELVNKIIDFFNIKTETTYTDRGVHLYFKKQTKANFKVNNICNLGFEVEYKNKEVITKVDGIKRPQLNQGERQLLPLAFKPNAKGVVLLGAECGDKRHNNMVAMFAKTGDERLCRFINKHIFAEPLDDDEFTNIVETEFKEQVLDSRAVALNLIDDEGIVKYEGELYIKRRGKWTCDSDDLKGVISNSYPYYNVAEINEIFHFIEYCAINTKQSEYRQTQLKNGVLIDGLFYKQRNEEFTPNKIDREYKPEALPTKELYKLLRLLFKDEVTINHFFEALGMGLVTEYKKRVKTPFFYILYGDGGDGKSVLIEMLIETLGIDNISATKLHDVVNPKDLAKMKGTLWNIGEDIKNAPINHDILSILKNITSLNTININEVYKKAQSCRITCVPFFTSNNLMKTFEKGEALERRIKLIDMSSELKQLLASGEVNDEWFMNLRTETNYDYLLKAIIDGCKRWLKDGFTNSERINEFTNSWNEHNDTLKYYVLNVLNDSEINLAKPKEVYEEYSLWVYDNDSGDNVQSKKRLVEAIQKHKGYIIKSKKINKKTHKVFVKEE